MTTIVCESNMA